MHFAYAETPRVKVLRNTWREMHEFKKMLSKEYIHTSAYPVASK